MMLAGLVFAAATNASSWTAVDQLRIAPPWLRGQVLRRRGCVPPAGASGLDTHRNSINQPGRLRASAQSRHSHGGGGGGGDGILVSSSNPRRNMVGIEGGHALNMTRAFGNFGLKDWRGRRGARRAEESGSAVIAVRRPLRGPFEAAVSAEIYLWNVCALVKKD
jgi:hypothetical protein